jgi:hypothetical protein
MEIGELINKVLWDRRYIKIPESIEYDERILILRYPNIEEKNYFTLVREIELEKCKDSGVPEENEFKKIAFDLDWIDCLRS